MEALIVGLVLCIVAIAALSYSNVRAAADRRADADVYRGTIVAMQDAHRQDRAKLLNAVVAAHGQELAGLDRADGLAEQARTGPDADADVYLRRWRERNGNGGRADDLTTPDGDPIIPIGMGG